MKRVILVVLLVGIAAIAGIVRSHSKSGGSLSDLAAVSDHESDKEVQEEIRKLYELAPDARVEIAGINGSVHIETSDTSTAEVLIQRQAKSPEALQRRQVVIENTSKSLTIRGEKGQGGFFSWFVKSNSTEQVTLRLPRRVSLLTSGVNGSVIVEEIDGPVEIHGVNGKVEIAQATGAAEFNGINGNIVVGLREFNDDRVSISGVNGNIELKLTQGVNAILEAHGMNGRVFSDLPDFVLEEAKHGRFRAHVGSGGNRISANGINGNIRFSRVGASPV